VKASKAVSLVFLIILSLCVVNTRPVKATEDSWATKAQMPTARHGLGVAVVNGKIYSIGGGETNSNSLNTNEIYDPETDTWTTKVSIHTPRSNFGIAVVQNEIYVIGGLTTGNVFTEVNEVYDSLTDTWENRTTMPTPRVGIDANVVDGKIYVIGGSSAIHGGYTNVNEVYDPVTDTWTTKASMPTPVTAYASAVVDNKIYVIGGPGVNLTQIYNPETDIWSNGAPIPTIVTGAGVGVTTGVLAPRRIYVIGGYTSSGPTNLTQVYDPERDVWSTGAQMPTARLWLGVAVVDDILYAIGGASVSMGYIGPPFGTNEQYTPVGYIPEFPSWTPMLLILIVFTVALAIYKRRLLKTPIH
jgi:N-acetylneuraminic acid mutarotase